MTFKDKIQLKFMIKTKGYVIKLEWVLIPILLIFLIGGVLAYWSSSFVQEKSTTKETGSNAPTGKITYQQPTYTTEETKKSIVYIRHDVTGCCDQYGQYSTLLGGSGSGVIYYINSTTVYVLTSRHVVDCVFAGNCLYPQNEKITIKAQNGKFYNPNNVWYAPQNLDLAILEFQTSDTDIKSSLSSENYSIGDSVIAIGYPIFGVQSTEPVLQFSVTNGKINNVYNLLTYQGLSFKAIQSDAVTDHGGSGGGLFNQDGYLLGIVTWGDRSQQINLAIDTKILLDIKHAQQNFLGCPSSSYATLSGICCQDGTISGTDNKCYQPCGKPSGYCQSPNFCYNNQCYSQCPSGYVFGNDGMCHTQCGNGYCSSGSYCYNNQCFIY